MRSKSRELEREHLWWCSGSRQGLTWHGHSHVDACAGLNNFEPLDLLVGEGWESGAIWTVDCEDSLDPVVCIGWEKKTQGSCSGQIP